MEKLSVLKRAHIRMLALDLNKDLTDPLRKSLDLTKEVRSNLKYKAT